MKQKIIFSYLLKGCQSLEIVLDLRVHFERKKHLHRDFKF